MQSKLSKTQKSILCHLYDGPCRVDDLILKIKDTKTKSTQNSTYQSLKPLINGRGLVKNNGNNKKNIKEIDLTNEGVIVTRKILIAEGKRIYFSITRKNMDILMNKLYVNNMFKETAIVIKNNSFSSIHRNPLGKMIRYINVNPSFFHELSGNGIIVLPVYKLQEKLKEIPMDSIIEFEFDKNKLKIITNNFSPINMVCKEPESYFKLFPYDVRDDIFLYNIYMKHLEVCLKAKSSVIKDIISCAKLYDDNDDLTKDKKVKFLLNDGKFRIRIGELNYVNFSSHIDVIRGNHLSVKFNNIDYGFKKIKNVFSNDITIKTGTDAPAIFFEKTKDYEFGIMIPPYIPPGQA